MIVIEHKVIATMNDFQVDGFGRIRPSWWIPILLLAMLLGLMAFAGFPIPSNARYDGASTRLALVKQACEIEGGLLEYTYSLDENGSLESISASCLASGGRDA